ncbi:MAG: Hsp20/alpha crystallin family protein [Acidimicrobiia bacterium]
MSKQLVRFDPWAVMRDFDQAMIPGTTLGGARRQGTWLPRIDVFEDEGALKLFVELAGVDAEAVEVTQEGRTLTIRGTRTLVGEDFTGTAHRREILEGDFERKVRLPQGFDGESITASSVDGILEVVIPLLPEVQPRKVAVTTQR